MYSSFLNPPALYSFIIIPCTCRKILMSVSFIFSAKVLQVWYKSIRTRYVKIARKKSQFGVSDLTERDHWIMMKFGFLAKHIGKVRLKTNFRVSTCKY